MHLSRSSSFFLLFETSGKSARSFGSPPIFSSLCCVPGLGSIFSCFVLFGFFFPSTVSVFLLAVWGNWYLYPPSILEENGDKSSSFFSSLFGGDRSSPFFKDSSLFFTSLFGSDRWGSFWGDSFRYSFLLSAICFSPASFGPCPIYYFFFPAVRVYPSSDESLSSGSCGKDANFLS